MNRALSHRPELRALVVRLVLGLGAVGAVVGVVVGYQLSAARAAIDVRVQGPIVEGVDSLNVGHAAAIAFAATRRPHPSGESRACPAGDP